MAFSTYMFDLGDSTNGPIGMVLRVRAPNRDRAIEIARETLRSCLGECDQITLQVPDELRDQVEYIRLYLNPDRVSHLDIYDEETEPAI